LCSAHANVLANDVSAETPETPLLEAKSGDGDLLQKP